MEQMARASVKKIACRTWSVGTRIYGKPIRLERSRSGAR